MQAIANFIDGQFAEPSGGRYLENVNPATGETYSYVPASDADDIDRAVRSARRAAPGWAATPAEQRCRVLLRIAELIEQHIEALAMAECVDNGKPLSRCRAVDIPRAVANFRFFATAVLHTHSELYEAPGQSLSLTLRRPRGVAGLISPWNLPLYLLTWKVAPALATGNTAVAKPSEVTPMTAHLLAQICQQAGLPPGVLNIVHGLGASAGQALVEHPDVSTISFTGGTATGARVAAAAAPRFKKVSLELGGKNPNVVFADADLDASVEASVQAAFANQGQICLCGSRLLVQRDVMDAFLPRFVERARRLRVGDPLDPQTEQGALVSAAQLAKSEEYARLAREEGGTLLCGGRRPEELPARCRGGYFFEPTVVAGLGNACRTNQEEIFGPIVSVLPFDSEEEAMEIANSTPYGLSASIWTRDLDRAHRVSERLDAGTVWVNCWLVRDLRTPFGGMKQSGVGREGGLEAIRFFTEPKTVCIARSP